MQGVKPTDASQAYVILRSPDHGGDAALHTRFSSRGRLAPKPLRLRDDCLPV